jgi:hypothetical protein
VLADLGFEAYLAGRVQSARALRENIFSELRETEYFLFIDFRREKLGWKSFRRIYRGSLFSHQELAIASFLDLEILVFQEAGVSRLDGMLGHIQGNAITFSDRSRLPELVKQEITKRGWKSDWRNELVLAQASPPFGPETVVRTDGRRGYFFHLSVYNRHQRVTAHNCYGNLRRIYDAATERPVEFESAEFKWAGYLFPNATIAPKSSRKLDALWIDIAEPWRPNFSLFTDSTVHVPVFHGPGSWKLEYEVCSDNVPGATLTLRLDLGPEPKCVRFGSGTLVLSQV